jgi:hypothetical protein
MGRKLMKLYKYGMRLRGFSIGCQPMAGLVLAEEGDRKYYNYLYYERKLTDKELEDYELDFIGED